MADEFRAVAARVHGVSRASILAGNGSDDILQIALRSYCGPGDVLVCPDPTYSLYPVLAELADVRLGRCIGRPAGGCQSMRWSRAHARANFFANPNSPSGTQCLSQISKHWRSRPRRSCWWTKPTQTSPRQLPESARGGSRTC